MIMSTSLEIIISGEQIFLNVFLSTLLGAKAFAQKGSLTKHVSSVHENNTTNKFECEICDHKASCQVNLNLHIKVVHHKIKDHCCDKCGKKFSWAMSLKKHRFKCQINYKCDFCTGKVKEKGIGSILFS